LLRGTFLLPELLLRRTFLLLRRSVSPYLDLWEFLPVVVKLLQAVAPAWFLQMVGLNRRSSVAVAAVEGLSVVALPQPLQQMVGQ